MYTRGADNGFHLKRYQPRGGHSKENRIAESSEGTTRWRSDALFTRVHHEVTHESAGGGGGAGEGGGEGCGYAAARHTCVHVPYDVPEELLYELNHTFVEP